MATQNRNPDDQSQRSGGYGGSTGGARPDPRQGAGSRDSDPQEGTGAGGRDAPITSPMDADEALGNRTGGYGGNPSATDDQADGASDR